MAKPASLSRRKNWTFRRMMLVTVDVSGLGDEEIKDEIVINIEDSGVRG